MGWFTLFCSLVEKYKNQISFVGIGIIMLGFFAGNWFLVLLGLLMILLVALVSAMFGG